MSEETPSQPIEDPRQTGKDKEGFEKFAASKEPLSKEELLKELFMLEQRAAALRKELDRLRRKLETDQLTGLANFGTFRKFLQIEIDEVNQDPTKNKGHTLIFADIDDFGEFNRKYGQLKGNETLKIVARKFEAGMREKGHAARAGGEELTGGAVISYYDQFNRIYHIHPIERVRQEISQTNIEGVNQTVTASVGGAHYRTGESIDDYIKRANKAADLAKLLGKNRAVLAEIDEKGNIFFNDLTHRRAYRIEKHEEVEYVVDIHDNRRRKIVDEAGKKPYLAPPEK